jgi:hypothetical protein
MTYKRVIPRDLFNEASLLKCLGRLYIMGERYDNVDVSFEFGPHNKELNEAFQVEQRRSDGSLYVSNVEVSVNERVFHPYRPLNSQREWPLYVDIDDEPIEVFDENGRLTPAFLAIGKEEQADDN